MSDDRTRRGGGKFPNRGDEGLALSEFTDDAGSPNRTTAPPPPRRVADLEEHRRGRASQERIPLGMAGMIGLGALLVASSVIFFIARGRRSAKDLEERTDE